MIEQEQENYISKSARKRQMNELQELGKQLCSMHPSIWQQLSLSDSLQRAMHEYIRLASNEAKRRQMQYIGKLIRNEDIEAINNHLHQKTEQHRSSSIRASQLPHTFNALMHNRESAFAQLVNDYPKLNRQQLTQLLRLISEDDTQSYPPQGKHQKRLWKALIALEQQWESSREV